MCFPWGKTSLWNFDVISIRFTEEVSANVVLLFFRICTIK